MKFFWVLTLFSFTVNAQRVDRNLVTNISKTLQNVTPEQCLDPNPFAPWCNNLYEYVCKNVKKTDNKLKQLNDSVNARSQVPANATLKQKNDLAMKAISLAETESFQEKLTLLRDDVRRLMDPAKWNVISLFNGNGYPSPEKQKQMVSIIKGVRLRTGSEYITDLISYGQIQNPSLSVEKVREQAINVYTSSCGKNGLEVNAFFDGESDVILCPGLVYSLADYKADDTEMKAALLFTLSHEVTHAIDYRALPEVYDRMKACYEKESKDPHVWNEDIAREITSDYYGALSIGTYLKENNITGEKAARVIGLAADGWCSPTPSTGHSASHRDGQNHPEGEFRVNMTIGRAPLIRLALGCDRTETACALKGEIKPK